MTKYQELIKDYILLFGEEVESRINIYNPKRDSSLDTTDKLKRQLGEIFISGYARVCSNHPTIMEPDDNYSGPTMVYPLEGELSRKYKCSTDEGFQYPGLKLNNRADTKNTIPYFPCCFSEDQMMKTNSYRYVYENNTTKIIREKNKSIILAANKHLPKDSIGKLPINILRILNNIYPEALPFRTDGVFYRKGFDYNKDSILYCLMEATESFYVTLSPEDKTIYKKLVPVEKDIDSVKNFLRTKVANNNYVQNYFGSEDELKNTINSDLSFENMIIPLEECFQANIIVFKRTKIEKEGTFGLPFYMKNYLQYKNKKSKFRITILLFETIGGEFARLEFPQMELIFSEGGNKYFTDSVFIKNIYKCMSILTRTTPKEIQFNSMILKQTPDIYGKIRVLTFENGVSVYTNPLPPLPSSVIRNDYTPDKCSKTAALNFLIKENILEKEIIVFENKEIGIKTKNFYIPIIPENTLQADSKVIPYPVFNEESNMERFNRLTKTARYLVEYTTRAYSKFLNDRDSTESLVREFSENYFIVRPTEYPLVPREFKDSVPGMLEDGKIIVSNSENKNRLIYALKLKIKSGLDIKNFKNLKFIVEYFKNIDDFKKSSDRILKGVEDVMILAKSFEPTYIVHSVPVEEKLFFLKLDEQVFLAKHVPALPKTRDYTYVAFNSPEDFVVYSPDRSRIFLQYKVNYILKTLELFHWTIN